MTIVTRKNRLFPNVVDQFLNNDWPLSGFNSDGNHSIPAVNIKEDEKSFVLELAAPGFKKEDLKIDLEDGVLTLSAELKDKKEEEQSHFTRREFNYRSFKRSFTLPENIQDDKIEASFLDGVLSVTLPKVAEDKSKLLKQIAIK